MKRIIVFIYFFLGISVFSQVNLDSLRKIWKDHSLPDSVRLFALNDYAWEGYLFSNPDSSFYFAQMVYDKSFFIGDSNIMGMARNTQGASFYIKGMLDSALKYYQNSVEIFNKINRQRSVDVSNNIAVIFYHKADYFKSLNIYKNNLVIQKENNDTEGVGLSYNNIGMVYHKVGDFINAIDNYFNSLKIAEELQDDYLKSTIYDNLGTVYFDQNKFNESINYFEKCLALQLKNNNKSGTAEVYINIGRIYQQQGDLNKALELYQKSHSISLKNELGLRAAKAVNYIGYIFFLKGEYDKAMDYFLESKAEFIKVGNKQKIAEVIINIAKVNIENGDYNKAEKNTKEAIVIANKIGAIAEIKSSSKLLYDIYKKTHNYKRALEAHENFHKLNDSILNDENSKKIIEKQIQYDYEKKTLSDSIRHAGEIILQQAKTKAEKQRTLWLFVIALLVILSLIVLFFQFKKVSKQKNIIQEKQTEIINSINYAKKIQQVILPEEKLMKSFFGDYFIFFQPKDIVGGDFYWFRTFGDLAVIACVDCTGHGVPGGFMSMMGSLLLDKIVQDKNLITSQIIRELNDEIIRVLKQNSGGEIQDGMDLSMCVVDKKKNKLFYSGARNGIYVIDNNEIRTYKADIFPAGGSYSKKSKEINRNFSMEKINLQESSWVLMYSDGYSDQIGGNKMRSMGVKKFEQILKDTIAIDKDRKKFLINSFNEWREDIPQIDDIMVIGFKL